MTGRGKSRSNTSNSRRSSVSTQNPQLGKVDQTRAFMEKKEAEREERRRAMRERKEERAQEEQRNIAAGCPGDVDFIGLVRKWREEHQGIARDHSSKAEHPRISICVRKRPVSDKEREQNDHDSVTCLHPTAWVHNAKFRVDGITKYLDHSSFAFDHAFDENISTTDVYRYSTMPLIDFVCSGTGGRATVFAYGQTGSGKTYTMEGIQELVAEDLFLLLSDEDADPKSCSMENTSVTVAFFEIYGGYIQDLLNERNRLKLLEDGKGEIVVTGLEEFEAHDPMQLLDLLESGNSQRTTHATEKNDTSSRSHAICQIHLRDKKTSRLRGKLSLVDLAGSERGSDTKSHNSTRRTESAEINTSLLALKECVRALDTNKNGGGNHVPYRASNLTKILKDCFTSRLAKTTMIATLSPGASSADHTINTLRYADRIKEKKVTGTTKSLKSSDTMRNSRKKPLTPPRKARLTPPRKERLTPPRRERLSPPRTRKATSENVPEADIAPDLETENTEMPSFLTTQESLVSKSTTHEELDEILEDGSEDEFLLNDDEDGTDLLGDPADELPSDFAPSDGVQSDECPSVSSSDVVDDMVLEKKEDDIAELRRTMEALYDEEDKLLNLHMAVIQENAEFLTEEGQMLRSIQSAEDANEDDLEEYASRLTAILERKAHMIIALKENVATFQSQLTKKKELSKKVREIN
eukprot:CAMPEP_0195287496 /NCGR_PEP_ID=MMETSP0707-20130614/4530_1 /TAXON_ID=33640 /ORGANISM="Asterionellopsis glacialis, Strain CCMP134" /LENGTH=694 /DNA_ID=CAMNT_0040347251 /DNA_START=117 /DNA_END=2201 /DNA_ORIENTATION=-